MRNWYTFTFKDGSQCVGYMMGNKSFDEQNYELDESNIVWCENY
jgi:hypothetical protein